MTTCGECGHEISTTAKSCPKCGGKVKAESSGAMAWVLLAGGALFVGMIFAGASVPDYKHEARERREACELIAAPGMKGECMKQYLADIEAGKTAKAK